MERVEQMGEMVERGRLPFSEFYFGELFGK